MELSKIFGSKWKLQKIIQDWKFIVQQKIVKKASRQPRLN